jgi:hypothetical protein
MSPQQSNGLLKCDVATDWGSIKSKIVDTHTTSLTLAKYLPHLEKLDALEDIKNHLLDAATGKNQLDIKVATLIFKILGLTILALLAVILFLLTGEAWGILGALHR